MQNRKRRQGEKVSRRDSLKAMSGMLMLGAGIGAVLGPGTASAADDDKLELKFFKIAGGKQVLLGTVRIPAKIVEALKGDDAERLLLKWYRQEPNKSKRLVETHPVGGVAQIRAGLRKK